MGRILNGGGEIGETKRRTYASIPPALRNFHKRYGIKASLVVKDLKREQEINGITVEAAEHFLGELFV